MENRKKTMALLEALTIVHQKLTLPADELKKMKSNPEYRMSDNKIKGINKIYSESWYRKKIDTEVKRILNKQDVDEYTKAMNDKFKQSQPINVTVNVDTSKYEDFLVNDEPTKEPLPIGFKQKSTLTPPANRYTMDNVKKQPTNAERFEALFKDI